MIDREIDWSLRWKWAYIPQRLWGLTLDDWPPQNDAGRRAWTAARHFVDTLPKRISAPADDASREDRRLLGVGMAIVGPHGTGKTELGCAILTEIRHRYPVSVCYVRVDILIKALLRTQGKPPPEDSPDFRLYEEAQRLVFRARRSRVTLFDDLGKEHKTDSKWANREINTLLRGRHETMRPSLVNSNDPVAKWSIYDDALPSFAAQALPTALLIGDDLRVR